MPTTDVLPGDLIPGDAQGVTGEFDGETFSIKLTATMIHEVTLRV
jgi:hypothetical protein